MIKKVLVYTYGSQSHENTINMAAAFASKHEADLTGIFIKPNYVGYSIMYGEYPLEFAQKFYNEQKVYAKNAKIQFEKLTKKYNCKSEWYEIDEHKKQLNPSLYSDYIFVSRPIGDDFVFSEVDFVDRLILETGLPTVVVPLEWTDTNFAQHPVLGWKETKESVNAVRHTLRIMRDAEDVSIVSVTSKTDLDKELLESVQISEYLSAHDVTCKFHHERMLTGEKDESQTLIRHIKYHHRDSVIIGGYSHSRFRELVLGGMTRELIRKSPVPVLLSH